MIIDEIRGIKSGKKDLRNFGLVMCVALALLGGLFLWRGRPLYPYFFFLSGFFLVTGLGLPVILKPLHKAWMTLAILLGWVVSRLILSILFFVILTPLRLISLIFGKRFLELRIDKGSPSYWNIRDDKKPDPADYEKQY